ncbi:MAG: glycosyltransferase family 4 protein, partial [Deltaproteobacteria bacterium]|nr:glycosyltransferase family 4 protein [Deltaproteobacteria bacterium]
GKGNYKRYLKLAKRLGIEKDVVFEGPVRDVKDYYYASDIFVLPSIYEPFSNACLEAMAAGLPVVTSRVNGVSEILTDGEDGMIIDDPTNPGEITEKIAPLLEKKRRLRMGWAARVKAEGYTIERSVEGVLRVVEG